MNTILQAAKHLVPIMLPLVKKFQRDFIATEIFRSRIQYAPLAREGVAEEAAFAVLATDALLTALEK
jgi:hypothetical protein